MVMAKLWLYFFDPAVEKFNEILLSAMPATNRNYISALDGCQCIGVLVSTQVHVWKMREYGDEKSWTKLNITFPILPGCSSQFTPLEFGENDQVAMNVNGVAISIYYPTRNHQYKTVLLSGDRYERRVAIFTESFISPNNYV